MLDFLSDILTNLSIKGTLYFRTAFSAPWGVAVPAYENVARFHFAHRNSCLVKVEGTDEIVSLAQGDLIIIPHGAAHKLFCSVDTQDDTLALDTVIEKSGYTGSGVLIYGEGDGTLETELICGHFSLRPHAKHSLMARLPPYIHLRNYGEVAGKWMEATLRMIGDEAGGAKMGGDLIALKMSEAIFTQAIRSFIQDNEATKWGLAGFADPNLSRALSAFHANPAASWTVETLASKAGMSRTSFAVLFQKKMQMTPMNYLKSWRMELAKRELTDQRSLTDAALSAGYASDSAFARTFKKETGFTPAEFKKMSTAPIVH